MAKLNKGMAKKTAEASSNFEPLEDGAYHVRLTKVDTDRTGGAGPYWSWEFDVVEPGDYEGRKLWNNTSLSEQALWKLNEAFKAFGVDTDTDTDELLGQVCKAIVSTRTIPSGARKGELGNQVDKLIPKDPDFEAAEPVAASGGSSAEEDIFN